MSLRESSQAPVETRISVELQNAQFSLFLFPPQKIVYTFLTTLQAGRQATLIPGVRDGGPRCTRGGRLAGFVRRATICSQALPCPSRKNHDSYSHEIARRHKLWTRRIKDELKPEMWRVTGQSGLMLSGRDPQCQSTQKSACMRFILHM